MSTKMALVAQLVPRVLFLGAFAFVGLLWFQRPWKADTAAQPTRVPFSDADSIPRVEWDLAAFATPAAGTLHYRSASSDATMTSSGTLRDGIGGQGGALIVAPRSGEIVGRLLAARTALMGSTNKSGRDEFLVAEPDGAHVVAEVRLAVEQGIVTRLEFQGEAIALADGAKEALAALGLEERPSAKPSAQSRANPLLITRVQMNLSVDGISSFPMGSIDCLVPARWSPTQFPSARSSSIENRHGPTPRSFRVVPLASVLVLGSAQFEHRDANQQPLSWVWTLHFEPDNPER